MRVTFVLSLMECGGTPASVATMANYWARNGWNITILGVYPQPEGSFFELNSRVTYRCLGIMPHSQYFLKRCLAYSCTLRHLRAAIHVSRPNVIISLLDYVNVLTCAASIGLQTPLIVSERTSPRTSPSHGIWKFLRRLAYRRASAIVAVSSDAKSMLSLPSKAVFSVIPGPIEEPKQCQLNDQTRLESKVVLCVGRLSVEKRYELVIRAFKKVATEYGEWRLKIIGDGPCRKTLEALIQKLELQKLVSLPGFTHEPYVEMQQAGIFVMCSDFEGYPRSLAEAMMSKLPVIATKCPGAVTDMVVSGVNGILVECGSTSELTYGLKLLMSDPDLRKRIGDRAGDISQICSTESTMRSWTGLVTSIIK